jgi:hypothetical protein
MYSSLLEDTMRFRFIPMLLSATLIACDQGTPLSPVESHNSVFDASEGAQKEVFEVAPFFFADFEHGLVYSIGLVTPNELACPDPEHAVFDGSLTAIVTETPSGRVHERWLSDRATLVVYGTIPPSPCELTSADEIGRGRGKFVYHNNHVFSTGNGASGWHLVGTVDLATGGRARLLVIMHAISVNGKQRVIIDRVEFKPIGG